MCTYHDLSIRITLERKEGFLGACPESLDDLQASDEAIGRGFGRDWNTIWKKAKAPLKSHEVEWRASQTRAFRDAFTDIDPEAEPVIVKRTDAKIDHEVDLNRAEDEILRLLREVTA